MSKTLPEQVEFAARAPGKIILSGEHAVVYGKPALAIAVDRFVVTTISRVLDKEIQFEFLCSELRYVSTLEELHFLKLQVDSRYQSFIAGKCSIKDVIHSPLELLQYAFIYLMEYLFLPIKSHFKIQVKLNILLGCGMGASAAVILSLIHALVNYFGCSLAMDKYLYLGREIENLQHGKSSGLDLFLSFNGGCYFFSDGNAVRRNFPNIPFMLINTGKPKTSTGECVEAISQYFQHSNIADDFANVTVAMNNALRQNNLVDIKQCVYENHKLLEWVGVVPMKVAKFIAEIKERGDAAKISGAGAVSGDNAGIVLVIGDSDISDLAKKYGYEILAIQGEQHGLQII